MGLERLNESALVLRLMIELDGLRSSSPLRSRSPTRLLPLFDIETALLQQLLNIAQRERIAKIPPHTV
jgi:hypothetical protein